VPAAARLRACNGAVDNRSFGFSDHQALAGTGRLLGKGERRVGLEQVTAPLFPGE
jgi:hypothetical protein